MSLFPVYEGVLGLLNAGFNADHTQAGLLRIYDPITTLTRLAYIRFLPGAKLHFSDTTIKIQKAGFFQSLTRTTHHLLHGKDQVGELSHLDLPLNNFVQDYLLCDTVNPTVLKIRDLAVKGLESLLKTYKDRPLVPQALQNYISLLQLRSGTEQAYPNRHSPVDWTARELDLVYSQLEDLENLEKTPMDETFRAKRLDLSIEAIELHLLQKDNDVKLSFTNPGLLPQTAYKSTEETAPPLLAHAESTGDLKSTPTTPELVGANSSDHPLPATTKKNTETKTPPKSKNALK